MRNLIIFQIVLDILAFVFFLFVAICRQDSGYGIATAWVGIAAMAHIDLLKKEG